MVKRARVLRPPAASRSDGFTLIEVVAAIAVLGIAFLGIVSALSFGLSHQSDGLREVKSLALAEAYLEEIVAKRYDENTPVGGVPACFPGGTPCSDDASFADGEARTDYDDVDDFDGLVESPPLDPTGVARTGYSGWQVSVSVRYLTAGEVTALGLTDPTDAKVVAVDVASPDGQSMAFSTVRANF